MSQFYYEVDKADLARVEAKLKGMETKSPSAIRNAINRTATKGKKMIVSGIKESYTMKGRAYGKEITIQRATTGHLDATIKSQGSPRTLKEYKYTAPKKGVKADIVKSGLKELLSAQGGGHAFIGKGKIAGLIAQRTSSKRLPIRIPKSVSVPKMVEMVYKGERGSEGELDPKIKKTLHDEIEAEIKKLM
jgi:hypothetical protein